MVGIGGIGAFTGFMRTRLNIEPNSPLKPTKVCFIFKSSRRSCSCQSCDTSCSQSWVLKSGLRNYGLSLSFLIAGSELSQSRHDFSSHVSTRTNYQCQHGHTLLINQCQTNGHDLSLYVTMRTKLLYHGYQSV